MTYRDFNPTENPAVSAIKAAVANLEEVIKIEATPGPLKHKALIDVRSASMFAVASLFE